MVRYVLQEDKEMILSMMELVKDDFAGYKEEDFLAALSEAIGMNEAFIDDRNGTSAGLILFTKAGKELTFLAAHPDYRKNGVAKGLIRKMAECFETGDQVSVVTFQDGDPKGIAARACYHSCGFTDAEELVVFDYPCQKMILKL
ncbi:GNAT family N-acetyltransferase [Hungatella hominis]|uniref:GNAT family N-acetyltransferase n=1 Tax=Hungatella hominis TaxID=2763050 RepID=A0ABR7H783_9FIRM|nr:GNAT family N-acetyltransferase [Hungatella hominis]MBC5709066.1 GNAT family N-acetyltransferase [Hungatella hominis]